MFEIAYDEDHIVKNVNLLFLNIYVPRKCEGINGCSRLLASSLPFQYKLWIIVELDIYNFIGWDDHGDTILIENDGMESYLMTKKNIFNITAMEVFFRVLLDYGFKKLPLSYDRNRVVHAFKHESFMRDCKINLPLIKNSTKFTPERIWGRMDTEEKKSFLLGKRMAGDLCFMCHGNMSFLQKGRMQLVVALKFNQAERIVNDKIKSQDQYHSRKRRWSTYEKFNSDIPKVEFPDGIYENPYESNVKIETYGRAFEYAGYFGKANDVQVDKFYGNLTPKFITDPKNGLVIKKLRYQKPGTYPEPEEINCNISEEHDLDLINDLDLNMPIDIPIQLAEPNNNDTYIHSLGDTELAKQLVTQYKSNPGSVPKIVINAKEVPKVLEVPQKYAKEVPKVLEGPLKYISMPGCEKFNATKSKRYTAPRILRPIKTLMKNDRKTEILPDRTYENPPIMNNQLPFMIVHNLSDTSDSSFEAPRVNTKTRKSRESSSERDFRFSDSSDEETLRSFMQIQPTPIETKKCPKKNQRNVNKTNKKPLEKENKKLLVKENKKLLEKENKKLLEKGNKKLLEKENKKKPVKERKKYVRAPKDPNAAPKPTKTGKKRGPYKKKVKPNVDSAPTEKNKIYF